MEKLGKILVVVVFAITICGLSLAHILLPDRAMSTVERRKLEGLSGLNWENIKSGDYFEELECYLMDQFPFRDRFLATKATVNLDVLMLRENNKLYMKDGMIFKLDYSVNEKQVCMAGNKISDIISSHPEIKNAYYSVIPDKNFFMAEQEGYPLIDYGALFTIFTKNVEGAKYIDITDCLTVEDYYHTDSHWRQERIFPVVERLCEKMGVPYMEKDSYEENWLVGFLGNYTGQWARSISPESLCYITSSATDSAVVKSVEHEGQMPVYDISEYGNNDPYDIFLSGAEAVITIDNPKSQMDRELILFRDSFGSSIAPLLIDSYKKITLIDLRYISSDLIDEYADFEDADILFLYSTMLINSGGILR